jgi:hypothetical protein
MRNLTSRLVACLAFAASHAAQPVSAQTVAAPAVASGAATDEAVALSPFVVSTEKDTGYIAADTLNPSSSVGRGLKKSFQR